MDKYDSRLRTANAFRDKFMAALADLDPASADMAVAAERAMIQQRIKYYNGQIEHINS